LMYHFFGGLAQLGERNAGSVEVRGSSPLFSITLKPLRSKGFSLFSPLFFLTFFIKAHGLITGVIFFPIVLFDFNKIIILKTL
jgi:hypothetical protein